MFCSLHSSLENKASSFFTFECRTTEFAQKRIGRQIPFLSFKPQQYQEGNISIQFVGVIQVQRIQLTRSMRKPLAFSFLDPIQQDHIEGS